MGRKKIWTNDAERKRVTKMRNTQIIAVDGEGYDENNEHKYTLLVASNGDEIDYVHNDDRLTTLQCLDFIIRMKRKYPQSIFISFAFNYDITHILYDLGIEELETLKKGGTVFFHGYRIRLRYGKRLWIAQANTSVQINDIFGFCQTSLIKSLRNWNISANSNDFDVIEKGKARRGEKFELQRELQYTGLELKYTIELFKKIRDSVRNAIEAPLVAYNGAGALPLQLYRNIYREKKESFGKHITTITRQKVLCMVHTMAVELSKYNLVLLPVQFTITT